MAVGWDIELTASDGTTPLPLSLAVPRDDDGTPIEGAPKTFQQALRASEQGSPYSEQLTPLTYENWARGIGLDYDIAPGMFMRGSLDPTIPGYACPSGAATNVALPVGGAGPIVAFQEYDDSLFIAQLGSGSTFGRVLESVGGTDTVNSVLAPGTSKYCRGLIVADDGSGNTRLYAMFSDGGLLNGEMYSYDGSSWSAVTTFGTNGRGPSVSVFWRDRQNIGAQRIVTISGPRTISYTRPNADPMAGSASWVEGVKIGTAYQLREIVGSRGHIYISADDGVYDLDEVGNAPNIMADVISRIQAGNGHATCYHDGYIYYALGRGLNRIRVDPPGVLQETRGQCAPGWGTPVENALRGYTTAMLADDGLWHATFNTTTRESYICWGKDRDSLGLQSPSPVIWHGPEYFFLSDYRVTRMHTSALSGSLFMWVGSIGDSSGTPRLTRFSMPLAGSPLQDLYSGGTHKYSTGAAGGTVNPYARIYGMRQTYGDKASAKDIHSDVFGTRGLNSSTKLTVYNRADPAPGSTSWGTGVDVTATPVQTVSPTTVTRGQVLQQRIDFFAPDGGASTPIVPFLESTRQTVWKVAPDFRVLELTVEYGDGAVGRANAGSSVRGPDWMTDQLIELTRSGRTTLRTPDGKRFVFRLLQVMDIRETLTGHGAGKGITARLRGALIGAA